MTDPIFEGVYGTYTIDATDRREVLGYRLALTAVAIGQAGLLVQWRQLGADQLWPWMLLMAAGLGLALRGARAARPETSATASLVGW